MAIEREDMLIFIVILGLAILVGLSVGVGVVIGGERNVRTRRRLAASRWQLWQWEQELFAAVEVDGCPTCVLLRRRAELRRTPQDLVRD
jgi:hypothetical protein